jgi:nucleotidyltransferase/DNA polymerase involved in DNA repair
MDAFFAAIEQRDHPEFKGKPVIVGADPREGKGRGVVSTCSYEARTFGIHSAMPIGQAWKRCPHGIYVPPNGKLYSSVSNQIFKIYELFTDLVEPLSIDEAFLDVTGSARIFGDGISIAEKIKKEVLRLVDLTCSIGVAPNKYLAKIASDLEKPDGLVVVDPEHIDEFLAPLDISRLWGAGKKTQEVFLKLGIKTIGDLARYPKDLLEKKFGKSGEHFYNLAHGIDNRDVEMGHLVKSVSNEHTFYEDTMDLYQIEKMFMYLSEKVGYRLRQKNMTGKTLHLKLRYDDFSTITRNKTLDIFTDSTKIIFETGMQLFRKNYQKGRKVRLIGIGISGFGEPVGNQLDLFKNDSKKNKQIDKIEDEIKNRFGKNIISRAESLANSKKYREFDT